VNVGVQDNVPLVLPAPAVNVAPAVMAVPAAVSEAIAGPSASVAETVKVKSEFSFTEAVAGAVTTGALPAATEMDVEAEPERAFAAVNVTPNVPVVAGVQLSVPDVLPAPAVNVAPAVMAVPAAVNEVIACPSGSTAETVKLNGAPTVPFCVAGAVTTGARSTLLTVIAVDAEPESVFVAVNVTAKLPACVNVGVQDKVPLVLPAPAVNVAPAVMAVPAAVSEVIAWASGSFAETVKLKSEFSFTEAVAGAVTVGARSTLLTVIAVDAEPESVFVAVNVTP
jgi:hypothetical protein